MTASFPEDVTATWCSFPHQKLVSADIIGYVLLVLLECTNLEPNLHLQQEDEVCFVQCMCLCTNFAANLSESSRLLSNEITGGVENLFMKFTGV